MTDDNRGSGIRAVPDGSLPQWAKTLGFLVGTVGFPTLVAVFLLAQTAGYLPSVQKDMLSMLIKQQEGLSEHRVRQEVLIDRLTQGFRILCENNAKTLIERNNCSYIK